MGTTNAQKRTANSAVNHDEDEFIEDVRGLLWKQDWQQMADKANLSYSTVRNFANGQTRKPHFLTICKVARALDLRIAFVPKASGPVQGEVNLKQLKG